MSYGSVERLEGGVAKLTLNTGRGNPITPAAVEALRDELLALEAEPPRALLIDAGGAPIFSGGFALPVIAPFDRPKLEAFFSMYMECLYSILRMRCPSVCAIGGHAVAAGFILSLATDYRVVTSGAVKLGLPEVDLGVAVPGGAQELFASRTSLQFAHAHCTSGKLFDAEAALQSGYAFKLEENADEAGLRLAQSLAKKPGTGAAVSRTVLATELIERVEKADARWNDVFLDGWFSEAGQACIQAQAARLSGGGKG